MQRPPDPRYRPPPEEPTWGSILAAVAVVATVPVLLWVAGDPLARGVALAALAGLVVGARRSVSFAHCAPACRELTVGVGRTLEVTVTTRWDGDRREVTG